MLRKQEVWWGQVTARSTDTGESQDWNPTLVPKPGLFPESHIALQRQGILTMISVSKNGKTRWAKIFKCFFMTKFSQYYGKERKKLKLLMSSSRPYTKILRFCYIWSSLVSAFLREKSLPWGVHALEMAAWNQQCDIKLELFSPSDWKGSYVDNFGDQRAASTECWLMPNSGGMVNHHTILILEQVKHLNLEMYQALHRFRPPRTRTATCGRSFH